MVINHVSSICANKTAIILLCCIYVAANNRPWPPTQVALIVVRRASECVLDVQSILEKGHIRRWPQGVFRLRSGQTLSSGKSRIVRLNMGWDSLF